MFDSIQADLNSRLLISSKASTGEAQIGTEDTHYMTPLKTQQKIDYLTDTRTITAYGTALTETLISNTDITGKIVTISGSFIPTGTAVSGTTRLLINASLLGGFIDNTEYTDGSPITLDLEFEYHSAPNFVMVVNTIAKTITGSYICSRGANGGIHHFAFTYNTFTNVQAYVQGTSSTRYITLNATIQHNR